MMTKNKKPKFVKLPSRCICGSKKGKIEKDHDDEMLYILRCKCGLELDHSSYKHLLGRKI